MNLIAEWMTGKSVLPGQAVDGRNAIVVSVLALWLLLFATTAQATNWNVQVGGSQLAFSPQTLTIEPGDTVTWINFGGRHNVTADDGSFRCANGCDGMGGNGAPSSLIWRATLRFDTPGHYGYFCEPHGQPGAGMFGTVIVASNEPPIPVPLDGVGLYGLLALTLVASACSQLRRPDKV